MCWSLSAVRRGVNASSGNDQSSLEEQIILL